MVNHNGTYLNELTHRINVIKYLMNSYNFVVQFIITCGAWKECITIGDEEIEDTHDLKVIYLTISRRRLGDYKLIFTEP